MADSDTEVVLQFRREVSLDALVEYGKRAMTALDVKYSVSKDYRFFKLHQLDFVINYLDPTSKGLFRVNRKNTKQVLLTLAEDYKTSQKVKSCLKLLRKFYTFW